MPSPIAGLFNSISESYDSLNHICSLNIDKRWRKKALRGHITSATERALDVACGTADLSIELVRQGAAHVDGVDISDGMLIEGRRKVNKLCLERSIALSIADCAALPMADSYYDVITIGFGVRNFEHRKESLKELFRVLKPGGELIILEFSTPQKFPIKQLYSLYFKHIMPTIGGWISGNRAAYEYLPRSVYAFPQGEAFLNELRDAGFTKLSACRLSFGIASVYYATKSL